MYPSSIYSPYGQQNGITWVQGVEGAKAFQLMPNSNIVLMDSENDGVFYIKVCDNVGMCTLRTFQYQEVEPTPRAGGTDLSNYITKDEFYKALEGLKNEQSISKSKQNNKPSLITE